MGGTFDPAHLGHLIAASEALYAFDLDRVLFVPAARPWQKSSYSDPEDRFLMTALATAGHRRFSVSRMELDRAGPTYTVDTMAALKETYAGDVSLFFILGADAALKIGSWVHIEGLSDLAEFIAVARPGFDLSHFEAEPGWPKVHVMEMPEIGISSSDIRARVRAGRPIDYLVPEDVARYIVERGLYAGLEERRVGA